MLVHHDPGRPFIVEIDSSNIGVRAILSQNSGSTSKFNLIPLFSQQKQNCGIGDRELLAIKLALEKGQIGLKVLNTFSSF